MMRAYILLIGILFLSSSCAGSQFRASTSEDSEASYRAFLAEHGDSDEAELARTRLEELAFQRARRGDDIAAYNRFLAEFPEGDFAREARELRAQRRLDRALVEDDPRQLSRLIDLDPTSRAAAAARHHLERLQAADLTDSDDIDRLRAFLIAFPQSESADELRRRLDDLEFARAHEQGDLASLRAYLEAHPQGIHRAEAREAVEELEADLVIASGSIEQMERFCRDNLGSPAAAGVRLAAAEALLAQARRRLDPGLARRAIDLAPESEAVDQAEALIVRLRRGGRRLERLRALIADLDDDLILRSTEELQSSLGSVDPQQRWTAVREVALSSDPATIDVAVEAAGEPDPLLHLFARAALATWAEQRGDAARSRLDRWIRRLRPRASNPEDLLRLAAVSDALGDHVAALRSYRRAADHRHTALVAASHRALLAGRTEAPTERRASLRALVDVGRARLEELLHATPETIDDDRFPSALQVLRGLEALGRILEEIRSAHQTPTELADAVNPPSDALDELSRLLAAAEASRRRLAARLIRHDPEALRPGVDLLQQQAAARRRRRLEAIDQLASMRAPEAIPALAEVAAERDAEVSRAALRAIVRIGGETARETMLELAQELGTTPALRSELLSSLRALARRARGEARELLEQAAGQLEQLPASEEPPL